ncbi:DASH complex subunit Hsk3 like-domain-containing protein [Aspergillus pseudotamarii]|uniref:DASH complex subunit Hsk3 like-domain-containing protein n=1 Tax=Aspergillus pseudotamarii TaxID=132259 RepID=A0A5N6SC55_ASPPS|nr:DASH complex subunit Hsk3 like-domain-containing protein [Aspergillus pseudotamarii]KAE8131547.1 DASH complex subunit Hsk3 like-domain-containing protein [Aspergillus pseudotamarii]
MPPSHHYSQSQTFPRHSILPPSSTTAGPSSMSAAKTRQYANLQAQLEQLNANLADTQNLLRMTSVQAEDMRFLGGYVGALFMGSAKVLGEEGVKGNADKKESES